MRFVGYQIFFGISKKNYITNKNFKNYKKKFLGKSIDIYKTKKNYEQNIKHFSIVLAWPWPETLSSACYILSHESSIPFCPINNN